MTTITYPYEELVKMKDTVSKKAVDALVKKADEVLSKPTLKMTDKKIHAPSGNIHDYMTMGLYWWPNPNTPDGLPYINKDGIVNPDSHDGISLSSVSSNIHTVALAAFYCEQKRAEYGEYAERQLYDWFINPETYMAPNARFAQAIPGICEGRSTGLVDFARSYALFDGIGIFEELGLLKPETVEGVRAWFVEFTNWMLTHENGIGMGNGNNNIGVWHDVQILAMAMFTKREALARNVCIGGYRRRVLSMIMKDGSQPSELKRTKAIGYSFYALDALMMLSAMAERIGYDYWKIDERRGECVLASAVEFVYPFVLNPESCPYPDLHHGKYGVRLKKALLSLAKRYPEADYATRADLFDGGNDIWFLEPVR